MLNNEKIYDERINDDFFEVKINKQNEYNEYNKLNNIKVIDTLKKDDNIEDYFVVSITPENINKIKNKNIGGNKIKKDIIIEDNKKNLKKRNYKNKDDKNKEDEYEDEDEDNKEKEYNKKIKNKGLSENTIKQYIQNLRLYCYNLDLFEPNKNFIKLHHKISERKKCLISKETIKSCLNAIIWILKETYEEEEIKNVLDEYKELVKHLRLSCIYDTYNQDRNNFKVPYWEIIIKRRDENKLDDDKYLISSLYTYMPPRRIKDYSNMYYITSKNNKKNKNKNYFCMKEKCFIFNNYKTKNTYGEQIIKISDNLYKIIEKYINKKNKKNGDILLDINNDKYDNKIKRLLKDSLGCGVDSLRHSFISYTYSKKLLTIQEIQELSNLMGHSIKTHLGYRKNFNNNPITYDSILNQTETITNNKYNNYKNNQSYNNKRINENKFLIYHFTKFILNLISFLFLLYLNYYIIISPPLNKNKNNIIKNNINKNNINKDNDIFEVKINIKK